MVSKLRSFITSPTGVMLFVSLGVLAFCIGFIALMRPFNSDDLYWQQAVHTWRPFSGQTFYFGTKDIFVLLGPFFAVTEWLWGPSRPALILDAILLTAGSFGLFFVSSLYFLRKLGVKPGYVTLLPFVWLASFGYPLVQNYLNSAWRTYQIGFTFATFALVAAILNGDIKPLRTVWSKVWSGVAILLSAVLMYGDPYYTIFTMGPLLLFVGWLYVAKKIDRRKLFLIYGGIIVSYILSKIVALICKAAGIHIVGETPSKFVHFEGMINNVLSSLHGLYDVFAANFMGQPVISIVTMGYLVNAILLTFILYKVVSHRWLAHKEMVARTDLPKLWTAFLALTMAFIFLVYTSSSLASDSNNFRFYLLFIYCGILLLAITLGLMKHGRGRNVLGALLVVATIFNVGFMLKDLNRTPGDIQANRANMWNYNLIAAVQDKGLTKGYGSYWNANVNTYLSKDKVTFLPALCAPDGVTAQFRWLIDGSQFDKKADRSFFVLDPSYPLPGLCTIPQLEAQFGSPQDVINVGDKLVLVYDYDISSRMRREQY